MDEVKRTANMVRMKLKSKRWCTGLDIVVMISITTIAMEKTLEDEQKGGTRHTADFRIRKAQVCAKFRCHLVTVVVSCLSCSILLCLGNFWTSWRNIIAFK